MYELIILFFVVLHFKFNFDEKDNTILRTFYDNIEKNNQLKTQAEQFINKNDENIKILKENEKSLYNKKNII